jgi:hypothetical protein
MDNNGLANDKLCVISTNPEKILEDNQLPKQTLESEFIVTECLSSCEDCNGRYEDNTGRFKIQCQYDCHKQVNIKENDKSSDLRNRMKLQPNLEEEL